MGYASRAANHVGGLKMNKMMMLAAPLMLLALPGCIAKTALDIATMPVRAGAQAADWATTSQDEADRNYGRKMREQEARDGKARKKADKERRRQCRDAGYANCD
ncbi:hypothetical protein FB595_101198 [Sphingobium sp. AEW010]|nr:hypothetical protein FB595_101198 [Sphingobium sp. AEW010]TWD30412.1 hypothetical protein FB596_101198 [Sphingobium sp. AEW013]TWD30833.1 hypothetical protein FB594_101217 [Sphingobium sp. AEW001]